MQRQLPTTVGETAYVLLGRSLGGTARVTTGTVTKITPTGQITVENGASKRRFNRGWEIGVHRNGAQLIDKETYDRFVVASDIDKAKQELRLSLESLVRDRFKSKAETLRLLRKALDDATANLPDDEA